jgi:hypothetical protein
VAELLRLIVDVVGLLFPFRLVRASNRGLYFFCGRVLATLDPGVYPVVPWFCDVVPVSVVPHVYQTPLQTVGQCSFSASLVVTVVDAEAAWTTLERWDESVVELATAALSEAVRAADGLPDVTAVTASINHELRPHGLVVSRVRLLDFVQDAPVIRLLQSQETRR